MPEPRPQIPFLYSLVRVAADWFFTTAYDFTTADLKRVPLRGSLIFAANHVSFLDPPAIGCLVFRQINYFARDTLFKGSFGKGLEAIGTIPVARDNADVKSLKAIFKSLKQHGAIAIYGRHPLARRHPAKPKPGAGMIAYKSAPRHPHRLFGS